MPVVNLLMCRGEQETWSKGNSEEGRGSRLDSLLVTLWTKLRGDAVPLAETNTHNHVPQSIGHFFGLYFLEFKLEVYVSSCLFMVCF